MSFEPATKKLTIGSIDNSRLTVQAQYNPKDLQIDQTVPWKKPGAANQTGAQVGAQPASGGGGGGAGAAPPPPGPKPFGPARADQNYMVLEFIGAEGRTMTVELLFDGYEGGDRSVDVAGEVAKLETMARVIDPTSEKEQERRPHHCTISWGDRGLPRFDCVIESLSTKYTMFSTEGKPLRATCTVKLKEAKGVDKKEMA